MYLLQRILVILLYCTGGRYKFNYYNLLYSFLLALLLPVSLTQLISLVHALAALQEPQHGRNIVRIE